jgi:alpha-L-arabinofuranosidase
MVLESNGYGVKEQRSWCQGVGAMVAECNGCGVRE